MIDRDMDMKLKAPSEVLCRNKEGNCSCKISFTKKEENGELPIPLKTSKKPKNTHKTYYFKVF